MHNASFSGGKPGQNATAGGPAPPQQPVVPAPPLDDTGNFMTDGSFDLSFTADGPDVLENFDFDSFLHNTDDANSFGNFDFMNLGGE
jgi:hypothetical protein